MSGAWDAVLWLHLVAMAFFVGGQIVLAGVLIPVVRGAASRTPLKAAVLGVASRDLVRAVARRFAWGSLAAVLVLLVTGAAMASHEHLWGSHTLQAKLGLVAVTAALVWAHARRPDRHFYEGLIFVASLAIVAFGVALAN